MSTFNCKIKHNDKILVENVSAKVTVNDKGKFKSWYGIIFIDAHIKIEIGQVYEIILDDGRSGSISFIKEKLYDDGNSMIEFKGMGALN